jgi:CrcB protein
VTLLLVVVGAAVGAPLRYLADRWVQTRLAPVLPVGTLLVNVLGSFALGVLVGYGSAAGGPAAALLGTGLCGALTTYSTFGYETVQLLADRARWYATLNILLNVTGALTAALLGAQLGTTL